MACHFKEDQYKSKYIDPLDGNIDAFEKELARLSGSIKSLTSKIENLKDEGWEGKKKVKFVECTSEINKVLATFQSSIQSLQVYCTNAKTLVECINALEKTIKAHNTVANDYESYVQMNNIAISNGTPNAILANKVEVLKNKHSELHKATADCSGRVKDSILKLDSSGQVSDIDCTLEF